MLICGDLGHVVVSSAHWPNHEVNQVVTIGKSKPTYASIVAKPSQRESYNTSPKNAPIPMEIDATRRRESLSKEEMQ